LPRGGEHGDEILASLDGAGTGGVWRVAEQG